MNEIKLQVGVKYTFIQPTGMTTKEEVVITDYLDGEYKYKKAGNRNHIRLSAKKLEKYLVFEGHEIPLKVDTESQPQRCVINFKFNFLSDDPAALKSFLETQCMNPSPAKFADVLYWPADSSGEHGTPLFRSQLATHS